MEDRKSEITRKTKETEIEIKLNIDGSGNSNINTQIGFLDHLLESFSKHGFFDLEINAEGDLETGVHHTIEDTGIVLGKTFNDALEDKKGIRRFSDSKIPMDEALASIALDISGRPYTILEFDFTTEKIGDLKTEMIPHFLHSLATNAGITLHANAYGKNNHHIAEAIFKSLGITFDKATSIDKRRKEIPSTKGEI